jgi:predicted unusual protein kinase regulating ubiquinone biosynthesis (AarF/ABC1/UbiB family)
MDLKNIKVLAKLLNKFDPKSDGAQRDWDSIYDESAKLLYKEIDYEGEARNCIRFKQNFADCPWIKVPEVKWMRYNILFDFKL